MKTAFTFAGVLIMVAGAGIAKAETFATPSISAAHGYPAGDYHYGYGHHASTYEEGVLAGWGALARARAEANYFNSLAGINAQEARSRYLRNREQATETYFRMQQINRSARESQRPQRLSREQYVAVAKKQAPDGLSEMQYDRTLGRLNWPAVLTSDEFASEREALNRAFMARSPSDAGADSAFYGDVRHVTGAMSAKLKGKIKQLSTAEYLAAKKFITGLAWESQQPLVVRALAAR